MNIVFLDRDTLAAHIQLREPSFAHHWQEYPYTNPEQIVERCQHAEVIISNKVPLSAELLAELPKLRLIAVAATGTNNVDLVAAREQGVCVCNIRDYAAQSIAEHCMALIFALRRSLLPYHRSVQQGHWQQSRQFCYFDYPITNISEQTLGLIGYGNLGQALAEMAQKLGMKVLIAERKGLSPRSGRSSFEKVLREADVLSLHCPLSEQTLNLIDQAELDQMKPNALLVNTARGGIINECALLEALQAGEIAGAASDVSLQEPPPPGSTVEQLVQLDNFIQTPHVGWAATSSMQALADQLIDNIEAFAAGRAQNLVSG